MEEKPVVLFNQYGAPLSKAAVPELDPTFLQSPTQLLRLQSDTTRNLLEKPYQYYSWVYAAVSAISVNLRRLTPYLYYTADENKRIDNHEFLRLLKKPNMFMNRSEFMEAIILNLMLPTSRTPGGQCFLIPGDNDPKFSFFKGDVPTSLFPFSDTYVFPFIVGGKLQKWELRLPDQVPLFFDVDQVVRIRLMNPYNWLQGMSPYSAAVYGIEADAKAVELAKRFSDNNANIGGILTTDKDITKDKADDLQKRWNQKYAGTHNTGRTAVLYNGLKFEQTSKTLLDMDFTNQRKMNREEVLAVYRVPKYAVSLYEDINYATSLAAKATFWEETLIPIADLIWDSLNSDWIENMNPRGSMCGYVDLSKVEALKKDLTSKIDNAKKMIQDGVPLEEAYRVMEIPVELNNAEWAKKPLVTGSRTDLEAGEVIGQTSLFGDVSDEEEDEDKDPDDPKPAKGEENDEEEGTDKDKHVKFHDRVNRVTVKADERARFWMLWVEKTLNPGEKKFNSTMKRFFIDQRNLFQDLVDEWVKENAEKSFAIVNRAFSIDDLIPSKDDENKKLKEKATPIYEAAIEVQAAKMLDEIGDFVNWTEQHSSVEKFKKLRLKQLVKINTNTFQKAREEIGKTVNEGIAANLTVNEIAKNIKAIEKKIFDVRINNALTIARTETASIASSTRFSIMDVEGINLHEWVSAHDEDVREHHKDEDGHVCEVGENFPVTGLLYPCYPGGAAEEVINCRCVAVAKKSK